MRVSFLGIPNAGKVWLSVNFDNRTATPTGGGSGTSLMNAAHGCTGVIFILENGADGRISGTADFLLPILESIYRGALQPA